MRLVRELPEMSMGVQDSKTIWKQARRPARRIGKRVTMTDVARLAGCSQATVSVVLNSVADIHISEPTRQRVLAAVRALGYRHKAQARPAGDATRQIALLVDRLAAPRGGINDIDSVSELAWRNRHLLNVFTTGADPQYERRILESIAKTGIDGIIYATDKTREVTLALELYAVAAPVVLLNCFTRDHEFPSVVPADDAAAARATRLLIEAGHTRIAHLAGELWMVSAAARRRGYRQALAAAGLPDRAEYVREACWQTALAQRATHELLDLPEPPTAIFCASDLMAVGCYDALGERGLSVPGDISVVGFDDLPLAARSRPPLTTLALPDREMGRWAVERVLSNAAADGLRSAAPPTRLECPLVERASVAPPPDAGRASRAR
jgi:LacI family transcriptional regulator